MTESVLKTKTGANLFLRRWEAVVPQAESSAEAGSKCAAPKAALIIIHGMTEHGGRYEEFARAFTAEGVEVWAPDMRGHGKTANPLLNPTEEGGVLGHCADFGAIDKVLADIDSVVEEAARAMPGVPTFMFGHSWGSFLVQAYLQQYKKPLAGCVLAGTRGPARLWENLAGKYLSIVAAIVGPGAPAKRIFKIGTRKFGKPFRPYSTPFDWMSRDKDEVAAFLKDPLCGKAGSIAFYRDLARLLRRIHLKRSMEAFPKDVPVYVMGGSADPVGDMGAGPTSLVNIYRKAGVADIDFVLYPECRHELAHELNRKEIQDNLCEWLLSKLK
jgi:alpha-beta hydrolase superfamily lysophospholipase